jgi:benzodiazapine receptor
MTRTIDRPPRARGRDLLALAGWLALCFAAAGAGSAATLPAIGGWYASIRKPSWTPPNGVFGPVWTTLYAMMAVSAWLVWREAGGRRRRAALGLFILQLALNLAWSILFFGLHRPGAAMADIVGLWLAIVATIVAFRRARPLAGAILVPYLAWVSFASALNLAIWRMNA